MRIYCSTSRCNLQFSEGNCDLPCRSESKSFRVPHLTLQCTSFEHFSSPIKFYPITSLTQQFFTRCFLQSHSSFRVFSLPVSRIWNPLLLFAARSFVKRPFARHHMNVLTMITNLSIQTDIFPSNDRLRANEPLAKKCPAKNIFAVINLERTTFGDVTCS